METSCKARCISAVLHVLPIRWRRSLQKRSQMAMMLLVLVALVTLIQVFFALARHRGAVPLDWSSSATAVDYVGMVHKPSCVNKFAISKLLRYQRPRSILLISPDVDACTKHLGAISALVRCIHEDSVLPNITKASVQEALQQAYPQILTASQGGMWSRTGWYLQQLLKLGVVEGLPDISEYYVIWDMDMIATRPLPIFFRADEGDRDARAQLGFPTSSQAELMHPLRTRVNIGGAWPVGYRLSYQHLFGEDHGILAGGDVCRPLLAADGTSFVSHWIVVHKPLMQAFLADISDNTGQVPWPQQILRSLPEEDLQHGFSEFHSYVSWVKRNHPGAICEAQRKTWARQPIGGKWGVRLSAWLTAGGFCCPTVVQHWVQWMVGFEYYGLEVGHDNLCKDSAQSGDFYGPQ